MPKPIQHYADIAVKLVRLYETRQKALMEEKKAGELSDMLPPSRTLKYKTYLGVFYVKKKQD